MRVVFLSDVQGVANGGDVKEVKNGFARNYLIPQSLAIPATEESLKRVGRLARQSDEHRLKTLSDMKELAEQVDGAQVNVEMRAGASGRLYGSVTNAIVAEKISQLTDREIDRRMISIAEPIREVGRHELTVRLYQEVSATIHLTVHPTGTDPEEFLAQIESSEGTSEQVDGDSNEVPHSEASDSIEATSNSQDSVAEQPEADAPERPVEN